MWERAKRVIQNGLYLLNDSRVFSRSFKTVSQPVTERCAQVPLSCTNPRILWYDRFHNKNLHRPQSQQTSHSFHHIMAPSRDNASTSENAVSCSVASTSENAVSCSTAPSIKKSEKAPLYRDFCASDSPLKPGSVVQLSNNVIALAWSRRGTTKSLVSLAPIGAGESDSHRLRLMTM